MTVTFKPERFQDVRDEALPLLRQHWQEVALDQDTVPLDPDFDTYQRLEDMGLFHVIVGRDGDGRLVGYACYFLIPNLHYRSLRVADSDIFWLAPEHRKGTTGIRLIRAAEAHMAALGANRIIQKVKLHRDVGAVFERMGYRPFERLYSKRLG